MVTVTGRFSYVSTSRVEWRRAGEVLAQGTEEPLEKKAPSGKWHISSAFSRQCFELTKAPAGFGGLQGCEWELRVSLFLSALFRAHIAKNRTRRGQRG